MAAAWLRQMGHKDVFVVEAGLEGVEDVPPPLTPPPAGTAPPEACGGALVIDLARSIDFRAGHIPGAVWGVRTRLHQLRDRIAAAERVVLTSPDGVLAAMAVDEVKSLRRMPVVALAGGTAAWTAAARPLEADRTTPADADCIDFYLRPYDRNAGIEEAMHAYLSWEIDLVHEIERDGTVSFGV